LLDLELLFHDLNFLHILTTCTFPRLRHFQCYLPYSKALASFLNRHKDINYLQLYPSDNASARDAIDHPPKVVLPKLEYLLGSDDCVSALAQGASLRAAFIEWTPVNQAVHECIAALQRSSADSLRVLSCHREGWNLDLLDAISSALPDILVLSITNVLAVDVVPNYVCTQRSSLSHSYPFLTFLLFLQSTLETMGTYLTRFTALRRLIIHSVDPWDFGRPPCWMDRDFARVRTWGMQCPSLVECTLPRTYTLFLPFQSRSSYIYADGLKWVRARDHIWFPDPTHSKGAEWLADMICSRRFPESEQLIDIFEQIVRERAAFGGASNGEPIPAELEFSIVRLRTLGRRYRDGGDGESDSADGASGDDGGEVEGEGENSHVSSEEDDVE
jgi:hypothetical protein